MRWLLADLGTHLSARVQCDELQRRTTDLNTADCVGQQLAVHPLELLEVLAMASVRCVVDVRDLLNARDMLQLQEGFLSIK